MNDELLAFVEREVGRWPGVISRPARFGAVAFRYGKREIGHVHHDHVANLPITKEMRERLLFEGRARPHRAGSKGYISCPVQDQDDVLVILEVLGLNYDRAKTAAKRRAASREEVGEA